LQAHPVYVPPLTEQEEIVSACNQFKIAVLTHAKQKKLTMQRCYAYVKSQFFDASDLLPRPDSAGSDRDNNPERPQVFIPVSREQFKTLYSYLKLTLFPNDEDYFRIRAKSNKVVPNLAPVVDPHTGELRTPTYPDFEDALTNGVKYIFRDSLITQKMGDFLKDLIWSGNGVGFPTFSQENNWAWSIDTENQQYLPSLIEGEPKLNLEIWDPIHFYLDPKAEDKKKAQWGYFTIKKLNEVLDRPYYFNKEKLPDLTQTNFYESQTMEDITLNQFNELNTTFLGDDKNLDIDHYYFPYLKTQTREYRNILVSVAGRTTLIEFRPNLTPLGLPPVVHWTWMDDKESPYGTGPIEDISDLQRHINIISNYLIETLARIGNRFIVKSDVDLTNFWGIAGGVATTDNPEGDMIHITGDYIEIEQLMNYIGLLKAEMQTLSGSQDPFQGASNIDFKKTATEIQVLQENAISVIREIVEHVSVGIQMMLSRFMYLIGDLYKTPIQIRLEDEVSGTQSVTVDFSLLKSGEYTIELIGANPSQSKQAQVQAITELIQGFIQKPEMLAVFKPFVIQGLQYQGIKDGAEKIDEVLENLRGVTNAQLQAKQPGIPTTQGSLAALSGHPGGSQPMAGISPPGLGG
jgi:hypothetical protein